MPGVAQNYLEELIRVHQKLGTLHSHEWHTQPLPPTLAIDDTGTSIELWQHFRTKKRLAVLVSAAVASGASVLEATAAAAAEAEADICDCQFAYAGACPCGRACECECDCPCAELDGSVDECGGEVVQAAAVANE